MLYAKVVVGLPVAGPFDYNVDLRLQRKIKAGCRVWVPWRNQKKIGYVVGLAKKTSVRKVKPIISLIDVWPVLDKNMLSLTRGLSDYYCCSWGEAIETALPEALRKGKVLEQLSNKNAAERYFNATKNTRAAKQDNLLIHDLEGGRRWDIYLKEIKEALSKKKSVILLFPDKDAVLKAAQMINVKFNPSLLSVLQRDDPQELQEWIKVRQGEAHIVIGRRSAIFAPLDNLGLIVIDEEQDSAYKQDQVPHYHARDIALMRIKAQGAKLILAGVSLSLESFYLGKKSNFKYLQLKGEKKYPELKISDMRYLPASQKRGANAVLSRYLQDCIALSLEAKDKTLLFLNRKGFARVASCISCGLALKCPRCSVNLVYYFKESLLKCHYCNFKSEPPQICPNCNAGYIKYSGAGTQKLESEVARIYPQARIRMLDRQRYAGDIQEADIYICGQASLRHTDYNFGLIGILSIDGSLNRVDFRAAEKTYHLLNGILRLTDKRAVIQTSLSRHHVFSALLNQDYELFYKNELAQRRQLNFPPYRHLGLVKIRAKIEEKAKDAAHGLFQRLKEANRGKDINIISVNRGEPAKLRGNFYWQILVKCRCALTLSKFLKMHLKDAPRSGIIVTVDIDPL
jgi:primosomal protein N' (replication factor Y)